MSTPRLTFLYPAFFRASCLAEPLSVRTAAKRKPRSARGAGYTTSAYRRQEARPIQRYGTANEPPHHLMTGKPTAPKYIPSFNASPRTKEGDAAQKTRIPSASTTEQQSAADKAPDPPSSPLSTPAATRADASHDPPPVPPSLSPKTAASNSLETVLQMPSPSEQERQADEKPPHLETPPYVHHFDTYSLVRDLEKGGFSMDQSVTIMKAIRAILADNMELARRGLVSKSNVENETYLFRAACSELRTEIQNNRKAETEKQRSQRNQLQHEVDILNQKMQQASLSLKDDLKGMFDDRKMAVRMEQKKMDSRIQELNYKITVKLNSDARSEVEGLRWVLTRRAAAAVAIAAVSILATLRYTSYMMQTQEQERKNLEKGLSSSTPEGVAVGEEVLAGEGLGVA